MTLHRSTYCHYVWSKRKIKKSCRGVFWLICTVPLCRWTFNYFNPKLWIKNVDAFRYLSNFKVGLSPFNKNNKRSNRRVIFTKYLFKSLDCVHVHRGITGGTDRMQGLENVSRIDWCECPWWFLKCSPMRNQGQNDAMWMINSPSSFGFPGAVRQCQASLILPGVFLIIEWTGHHARVFT